MVESLARPGIGIASGPGLVPDDLPFMARLAGTTLASKGTGYVAQRYGEGSSNAREDRWSLVIGCNMAVRKAVFDQVGGFSTKFFPCEEMFTSFRITRQGYKLMFRPDASVYHYPRASLPGFCKQIYGYGKVRIRLIRSGVELEPTTIVPGVWVLSLAVLGLGSFVAPVLGWLLPEPVPLCPGLPVDDD